MTLARRHCLIFFAATFFHLALLQLPSIILSLREQLIMPQGCCAFLSNLLLLALQAISLRYLLSSTLIYSFENIDFGQMELVRNMNHVKRMFEMQVQKYSSWVSAGVTLVSCALALSLRSGGGDGGGGGGMAKIDSMDYDDDRWDGRAYKISIFLTSRLGVFVLAALVLSRMLLPPPKHASRDRNLRSIMDQKEEGKGRDRRPPRHARSKGHLPAGGRSWSATFLLAAAAAVTADASSNYSPPAPAASSTSSSALSRTATHSQNAVQSILVAGSLNADTFLPVHRIPSPGENLTLVRNQHPMVDVPGVSWREKFKLSPWNGAKKSHMRRFTHIFMLTNTCLPFAH